MTFGATILIPNGYGDSVELRAYSQASLTGPIRATVEIWEDAFAESPSRCWYPVEVVAGLATLPFRWGRTKGGSVIVRVRASRVIQVGTQVVVRMRRADAAPVRFTAVCTFEPGNQYGLGRDA